MQFLKKHKKKLLLLLLVVTSCLIFLNFPLVVHAKWYDAFLPGKSDTEKALKFLNKYADKLMYSDNPMKSMLHTVGWFLVECCYKLSYFFETSLDGASLLSLFSFVDGKGTKIHGIYSGVMTGVVWGLLVLTLCFCGYKLILGKSNDLKNLGVNICLSAALLALMPTLFGTGKISGESFARALYNDAKDINTSGKSKSESLSFSLIKENCTDWIYVSQNSKWGDIDKGKQVNALSETKFKRGTYPLSNLITSKAAADLDTDDGKYLQYHLSQDDHDDTKAIKATSLMSWAPKAFQSGYYQYTLTSTVGVLIGLLALVVAFAFNAFVIIRTIIELGFKRIIAPVIFSADVETLQKSKMVLTDIMKGYLTIGLTELSMVIFQFWISFVNTKNMNLMLKVIAYCAGVWVLIVGSTSVLRYFDVDIGLQQGKQGLGAGLAVGAAIGKGGKSVKSAAGTVAGATVAGAAGIMNGLQKGAGMKLSQSAPAAGSAGESPSAPQESLSDRADKEQQNNKNPESANIQARKPSLVKRAARATGQKIQSAASQQMEKHPAAAKIGGVAGTVAGAGAGLGIRGARKLSGLDQTANGNTPLTQEGVAQTRSNATKVDKTANDPLKRTENLSQKSGTREQEHYEAVEQPEQKPSQQKPLEQAQEHRQTESHQQAEVRQEHQPSQQEAVERQPSEQSQAQAKVQQEQPQERQSEQEVRQQAEATQVQAEATTASQQTEVHQVEVPTEAPQTQEGSDGMKDYSQYIKGDVTPTTVPEAAVQPQVPQQSSGNTTVTAQQQSVQQTKSVQKRPETPPTKPDDNVLNNPWGNVQNDRS